MTTEEKAKAYDDALERARVLGDGKHFVPHGMTVKEYIFPELRESEDERIRKRLVTLVEQFAQGAVEKPMLAYLEKQKVQKPELVQHPPITYTYNSNASRDERLKAALLALLNSDLLKVKEGGYFTKQDLIEWVERIPTDKPAWSEEDEFYLGVAISMLKAKKEDGQYAQYILDETETWLKSLRPGWKPTEEQMEAFEESLLSVAYTENKRILESLYEQLKKL